MKQAKHILYEMYGDGDGKKVEAGSAGDLIQDSNGNNVLTLTNIRNMGDGFSLNELINVAASGRVLVSKSAWRNRQDGIKKRLRDAGISWNPESVTYKETAEGDHAEWDTCDFPLPDGRTLEVHYSVTDLPNGGSAHGLVVRD